VSNISCMASSQQYKQSLDAACSELEALIEQREEIDIRISQLKQAIVALSPLGREEKPQSSLGIDIRAFNIEVQAMGITESCREALKSVAHALTPLEVKARIVQLKPQFAQQKNLMASVHTVLKRLVVSNEAAQRTTNEGDVAYAWIHRRFPRLHRHRRLKQMANKLISEEKQ